jgi:hypothetical protein
VQYSDRSAIRSVNAMIADGGYELNFENSDVQDPPSNTIAAALYTHGDHYMVYQALGGVFALDLDNGDVLDILLDGREDANTDERTPSYGPPTVTTDGQLYVQDNSFVSDSHAVYHVDLSAVLP